MCCFSLSMEYVDASSLSQFSLIKFTDLMNHYVSISLEFILNRIED